MDTSHQQLISLGTQPQNALVIRMDWEYFISSAKLQVYGGREKKKTTNKIEVTGFYIRTRNLGANGPFSSRNSEIF